ncbi:MAG: cupredoxin domain-containing protein [Candidatus Jorgensenbacteria bacterium]|nr:cupredoxin domain-containing protein [Candidatus Jorgensenbacteria bacterium]
MDSNVKRDLIIGLLIVLLIAGYFSWSYYEKSTRKLDGFRPWNSDALPSVQGGTREKLSIDIETPDGATSTPTGVAVPISVNKQGSYAFRVFEIQGNNNKYVPSVIVVNEGDTVDLRIKAIDNAYDFFLPDTGSYRKVLKGETGRLQFSAASYGQYEFFCRDSCVGRDKVGGTLIVNKLK